jgi:hypothetical protein
MLRNFQGNATAMKLETKTQTTASLFASLRWKPLQQLIRAMLRAATFGVAEIIMLLAIYFNGYIIIPISIGAIMGSSCLTGESGAWLWVGLGMAGQPKTLCRPRFATVECAYYDEHGIRAMFPSCEIPIVQEADLNLSLAIRVPFSLPRQNVVRAHDRLREHRGCVHLSA